MEAEEPSTLSWALHHLAVAVAETDAVMAQRLGIAAGDYLALKHIAVADEPLGPAELGRLLGLTSGAATGLVDRLQHVGFVERKPHPDDRRRLFLFVTERGQTALIRELDPLAEDIERLAAELTTPQRILLIDTLLNLVWMHRRFAR